MPGQNSKQQALNPGETPPEPHLLACELLLIDDLVLSSAKLKHHSRKKILGLADTMRRLKMNVPVIVDGSNTLLAGEARVRACREIGWTKIPAIRLDHLTPDEAKAFMIAENRFAELSEWDERALGLLLKELSGKGLDFSLELTGFETGEIDLLIGDLDFSVGDESPPPEPDIGPTVAAVGDIWRANSPKSGLVHRLAVADSLEAASYPPLMAGARAQATITDPPFGPTMASYLPSAKKRNREFVHGSEGLGAEALAALLERACVNIRNHCAPGALVYMFMDWRGLGTLLAVGERIFGELKNLIIWGKTAAGMGGHYRSQHETCPLFKIPGAAHQNNIKLGVHRRNRSNLWSYPGMTSASARKTSEGDLLSAHPTCKPASMIADAILDCTERGGIVLDPFLGSGTTLVAAERTGRVCYGLELDPRYADVALRRFRRLTGVSPVRERDGRSFDELEREARDGR